MRVRATPVALIWLLVCLAWGGVALGLLLPWVSLVVVAVGVTALAFGLAGVERGRRARFLRWAARRRTNSRRNRRRLAMLRASFNSLDTPLFLVDRSGMIRACNRAGERMFPKRERVVGAPLEDLFTQREVLSAHALAWEGVPRETRVRVERAGGVVVFDLDALPVETGRTERSRSVLLCFRDVTEHATAMQLKTDFAANASHELRTPLAAIRGAAETLASVEAVESDSAMHTRLVTMIGGQVERLESLVNDLLDLSRLEGHRERAPRDRVDVGEILSPLAEAFEARLRERSLELRFNLDSRVGMLLTNRRLFETILQNLIENATKYASDETAIRVNLRVMPAGDSGDERDGLRMEVVDRGQGIPLEHQPRIFERFFQVDPSRASGARRGTGLGLAIVKHAARNLGGTVGVESVWKKGSTFWVELPDSVVDEETTRIEETVAREIEGGSMDGDVERATGGFSP